MTTKSPSNQTPKPYYLSSPRTIAFYDLNVLKVWHKSHEGNKVKINMDLMCY